MHLTMTSKYLTDEPLAKYTTYKIGGKADKFFMPETKEDLLDIINSLDLKYDKPLILGWGSNVLVSSLGYRGSVISTRKLNSITIKNNNILITESGTTTPKLAQFCLNNQLSGLEFLCGIPGTAGGAIYMNSSANGQCISDTIIEVELLDLDSKSFKTVNSDKLELEYRKSNINTLKEFIVSAKFKLHKDNADSIRDKMNYIKDFRKNKQPKGNNAGSVFKNPDNTKGISAGLLIDQAGLKGYKIGGAEVSMLHANFINNVDDATSLDVSRLMLFIQQKVKELSGYSLLPEIKYIGQPTEEEENIWKILQAQ